MGKAFANNLEYGSSTYHDDAYARAIAKATSNQEVDALVLEQLKLQVLTEEYFAHYGEPRSDMRREVDFDSKLFGPGRIDGIIDGGIGVEDKLLTKGFFHTANEEQLAIDAQVTAYMAAMRDAGTPLYKMKYRITWKPGINPDGRKKETLEQYEERLRLRIKADPRYAFSEYDLYRSDAELDNFIQRKKRIQRMVKQSHADEKRYPKPEQAWPENFGTACTLYGGCDYLPICTGDVLAEGMYRKAPERPSGREMRVLEVIAVSFTREATIIDVAKMMGVADHLVRYSITKLCKMGLVEKFNRGGRACVRLTESGTEIIDG